MHAARILEFPSAAQRLPLGISHYVSGCTSLSLRVDREFSEMSESQQEALLMQKANLVFSRAEPKHKQVRTWVWVL